jgi:hypothetical protein
MNQPQRKEDATQAHVESMKRPVERVVSATSNMRSGIIKRMQAETSTKPHSN